MSFSIQRTQSNLNGYEIINKYFDELFAHNPKVVAFGEDVGKIGDVNQGFAGLQTEISASTGYLIPVSARLTIVGQGIGLSMRGLRPIAEIQYLDYILYGLQTLSDDAASMHWRTKGRQSCPMIIRTRGHRLEGIWHSGSPMGLMLHALRGLHICVPRNMVQAVGLYNTLLEGNDPGNHGGIIEWIPAERKIAFQHARLTVLHSVEPEIIREGTDITIVSYGSTLTNCRGSLQNSWKNKMSVLRSSMCKHCFPSMSIIPSLNH